MELLILIAAPVAPWYLKRDYNIFINVRCEVIKLFCDAPVVLPCLGRDHITHPLSGFYENTERQSPLWRAVVLQKIQIA